MQDGDGLKYLLTDHLGSVVAVSDAEGALLSEQRYLPFGEVRAEVGTISQTDFGYTGQRSISMLSIMDYIARFYDPAIGRFIQPDTIIPNPANPQSWNRYSYAKNNPSRYIDPTGHKPCWATAHYSCRLTQDIANREYAKYSKEDQPAVAAFFASRGLNVGNNGGMQATASASFCMHNPAECYNVSSPTFIGSSGSATKVEGPLTSFMLGLPGTSDQWATVATGFDIAAWLIDLFDVGVVTAGGIMGAGIPAAFLPEGVPEVPVVTGLAGMAIAELYVQPPIQVANGLSLISTSLTVVADTKAGTTRLEQGVIGTNVLNSATTTGFGFAVPEAYLSLIIQSVAVANDLHWISFPFPSWSKQP